MGSGLFLLCAVRQSFRTSPLRSFTRPYVILWPFLCHSEEVARPTKNLIQSHSERSKESISTLNFCEQLAVLFSFSCTFLCKKVPKSFCTVKMAASVFGRSLSGHGRLTLFRTPAPGARSLDERNPAISTSAEQRFKCPHKNPPSFRAPTRHSVEPSPFCHSEVLFLCHSEERHRLDEESVHGIACKRSLHMLRSSVHFVQNDICRRSRSRARLGRSHKVSMNKLIKNSK